MKKIVFSLFLILISIVSLSQQRPYIIYNDSTLLASHGTHGNTLIIRNDTKDTIGFLLNIGNGITRFQRGAIRLTDSSYLIGNDTVFVGSSGGFGITDTTIIWVKWPILIDSTTHPGDTTILFDITTFDSLLHKFIDTGSTIRNGYVLGYDSTNAKWIMVAPGGSPGPPFGRFGIEDIAGTQNRAVDMEGYGFRINNLDTFLLENNNISNYANVRLRKDGGGVPYVELGAFSGTFPTAKLDIHGDAISFDLATSQFFLPYPTLDSAYHIPISVNGNFADAAGNIVDTSGGGGGADTNFGNTDITFTADRFHDLNGKKMFLSNGFVPFFTLDPTLNNESFAFQAYNPTGSNYWSIGGNTTATASSGSMGAIYNSGEENASITVGASSGQSTINFSGRLHNFSSGQIRASAYGLGTQLSPGLYIIGVDGSGNFVELNPPVYTDNADAISNGLTQGMPYLVNSGGTFHLCLAVP